jgi:hypothetical protein
LNWLSSVFSCPGLALWGYSQWPPIPWSGPWAAMVSQSGWQWGLKFIRAVTYFSCQQLLVWVNSVTRTKHFLWWGEVDFQCLWGDEKVIVQPPALHMGDMQSHVEIFFSVTFSTTGYRENLKRLLLPAPFFHTSSTIIILYVSSQDICTGVEQTGLPCSCFFPQKTYILVLLLYIKNCIPQCLTCNENRGTPCIGFLAFFISITTSLSFKEGICSLILYSYVAVHIHPCSTWA